MDETVDAGVEQEVEGSVDEQELKDEGKGAPPTKEDDTDWEAIAAHERERAENYKKALTQKRQLRNIAPPPVVEDDEDDKPLTRKDIRSILREEVIPVVSASKEDSLLTSKITDPAKRAYVKQLLETRIVRTGTSDEDITNDIDAALAIADSKKKDKTITELKRAADNKPKPPTAGGSNEKPIEQKAYKWTAQESAELEKKARTLGVDPEKFKQRAWENKSKTRVLS